MTLAKTILMEPLKRHLRYTMLSGYVANKLRSVSTLIIAPAERGKSTETTKFDEKGSGVRYLNDFSSWGLRDLFEDMKKKGELGSVHHIAVADLERLSAKPRNQRAQILADIRFVAEEGLMRTHTFFSKIDSADVPIQCGFILCTTKEDVSDKRSLYRKGKSFTSRFVPFTYDFSNNMRESVLDFVMSEDRFIRDKKESLIGQQIEVNIPEQYRVLLKMHAKILAHYTDDWTSGVDELIGIRALENLMTYLRAIALHNGRQRVTDEEYQEFYWLNHWMNFKFYNIDEFERRD